MSVLHVSFCRVDDAQISIYNCPTCKKRTRFFCTYQEWYGWRDTCLSCGEQWNEEGEMAERPFCRGWRQDNIMSAYRQMAQRQIQESYEQVGAEPKVLSTES